MKPKDLNVYSTKPSKKKSIDHKSKNNNNSSSSSSSSSSDSCSSCSSNSSSCKKKSSKKKSKHSKEEKIANKENIPDRKGNHSRASSCDSSSSLISTESQNRIHEDQYLEYEVIKTKIDQLNDIPIKSSIPIFECSSDSMSASMELVKKKVLAETDLIQNRQSLKVFDFSEPLN